MEEEQREGLTVGDVMRVIGRKIWYILGATVLFTVAMVLLLEFAINPLIATYSMNFRLTFPKEGDATYPDGSPFFYQDMVSSSFLADAKSSDDKFSHIDTDKMIKNGDITIEAETVTEEGIVQYTGRYTVTVKGAYFHSGEEAEAFIEAIANAPVERMRSEAKKVNYASDKAVFSSAPFEERLGLLEQEKATLLAVYDGWIDVYSETYSVRITGENGPVVRRLKDFRDSVSALFSTRTREELENALELGGYYFGDLDTYISQLMLEYGQNAAEIEEIRSVYGVAPVSAMNISSAEDLSGRLAYLIKRNTRIENWIGIVVTEDETGKHVERDAAKGTLQQANVDAFAARLDEEFDTLNREAALLTDVIGAIYARGMSARFDTQKVGSSGDIGIAVGAIGSFVGGFIIAAIVAYIIGSKKKTEDPSSKDEA